MNLRACLAAAVVSTAAAVAAVTAVQPARAADAIDHAMADPAAQVERGRAIYFGEVPLKTPGEAGHGAPAAPCVRCHRPSGMGNFEGGVAAPPIAARTLFAPYDFDTGRYFGDARQYRVRPAYDEATLATLLRSGVAPDGHVLRRPMPRYTLDDAAARDLAAFLRTLSAEPPPGVDEHRVRLATITTPEAAPERRAAMLAVLEAFVAQKNGGSRHEARRAVYATHTREMVMAKKFRHWDLVHWALEGPPGSWADQLDRLQATQPVFAVVAGLGGVEWAPVDAFCNRARVPCLLPLVEAAPPAAREGTPGFYGLYFHAGLGLDAQLAAEALRAQGVRDVRLWGDPAHSAAAALARRALAAGGLRVHDEAARPAAAPPAAIVSLLEPAEHLGRLATLAPGQPVAWLPGARAMAETDLAEAVRGHPGALLVTPLRVGDERERALQRARAWLRGKGLQDLPIDVAAATLQAATVLGDALFHIDFDFSREYLIELLEHGLENMPSYSAYPRLAIAPDQRIASKGSYVGRLQGGRIDWQWRTPQ